MSTDQLIDAEKIDTQKIEELQENIEKLQADPSIIQQYLNTLPQKALTLGIRIVLVVVVFFIGSKIISIIRKLMRKALGLNNTSPNVISFLDNMVKWMLYVLLVFFLAINFGIDASSIVAVIGSVGVAIALALQGSLSDLAGGVLILLLKPFEAGNYIKDMKTGITGTVEEVKLFHTRILTDNRYEAMLPNGPLAADAIINYSRYPKRQAILPFQISYRSDVDKARSIILDIISSYDCLTEDAIREPKVFMKTLDESGVTLELRAFVTHAKYIDYCMFTWEVNEKVKQEFEKNGIEIPFPQLDVNFDNESLNFLTKHDNK